MIARPDPFCLFLGGADLRYVDPAQLRRWAYNHA